MKLDPRDRVLECDVKDLNRICDFVCYEWEFNWLIINVQIISGSLDYLQVLGGRWLEQLQRKNGKTKPKGKSCPTLEATV